MPESISPLDVANDEPVDVTERESATVEEAPGDELGAIRALVLRAHPDVVPELVRGSSVAELLASVEPARSAYGRLAEAWTERESEERTRVPAGGGVPLAVDAERLPAAEKIRRGLTMVSTRKG